MRHVLAAALPLAIAACTGSSIEEPPMPSAQVAGAVLTDASGARRGQADFTQRGDGVRVEIRAEGLEPGAHGAHIHETGACVRPDFESAGGHWNPYGREHGRANPQGQHMGDMPNLIIGEDGTGVLQLEIEGARIAGGTAPLLDADGAAVVIHSGADDYRTDPAGNAGSRVACGEIAVG